MFDRRLSCLVLVFLGITSIGACNTTGNAHQRQLQHDAVNRWTQCIERFSQRHKGSSAPIGQRANRYCEGHRRDVLALYSPHLQNQIESLLSQRADAITAARVVRTGHSDYLDAFQESRLQTLKNGVR